jgi:2-C-methyl-D-erythritol 4-phosphate cytidylyltransferase/2-C-methyl-D-erythritol 2,4-cyclodiphosphate synthase
MRGGVAAVVVAAGRGVRAGSAMPKQYRLLDGIPVIRHALMRFVAHPEIDAVQPVIHHDDRARFAEASSGMDVRGTLRGTAFGGATRQVSVRCGLEALEAAAPRIVLVHDAARPFPSPALISRAIAAAAKGAAVPGLALTDTIKRIDAAGRIVDTLDRGALRAVQTPQAFQYDDLFAAHRRAQRAGREDFTDDAALAEWAGMAVTIFEGEAGNMKLTTEEDFVRAETGAWSALPDVRTAAGYDVHAFTAGDHVWLGGIRIAHDHALSGHSDADVALHALVDAVLGTLAEGDIGDHFPPSDAKWRGASSDKFLAFAVERVRRRGGRIAHLDVTIICESPRIATHRDPMRERIATIAGISANRVAVKATTNERLGFIGRSEGIAAIATATIRLPPQPD